MKFLKLILVTCSLSQIASAQGWGYTQDWGYKGYVAFSKAIQNRVLQRGISFDPISIVGGYYYPGSGSLADLLGVYSASGTDSTFINKTPNGINVVIWNMIFIGMSKDVGSVCLQNSSPVTPTVGLAYLLKPELKKLLVSLCQWPAKTAKQESLLAEFWLTWMQYDAPEAEYLAWKDFFLTAYAQTPAAETVEAMVLAMLNQHYFILGR